MGNLGFRTFCIPVGRQCSKASLSLKRHLPNRLRQRDKRKPKSWRCTSNWPHLLTVRKGLLFPNWSFQPHKVLFDHQSERDTIVFWDWRISIANNNGLIDISSRLFLFFVFCFFLIVLNERLLETIRDYYKLLFFPHFDVICDLLLLRRIVTWNNLLRRFFKVTPAIDQKSWNRGCQ